MIIDNKYNKPVASTFKAYQTTLPFKVTVVTG